MTELKREHRQLTRFAQCFEAVRQKKPLVHAITNYVTANDCANILLALGASPIMADAPEEAEEITAACDALVINIGTPNTSRACAFERAADYANRLNHPVILDPVGVGASSMRFEIVKKLLTQYHMTAIRGNLSEIQTLSGVERRAHGVDTAEAETVDKAMAAAKDVVQQTGAVVALTGAMDIVADRENLYLIENGHPMLSQITGSGCMLSALMGAFAAANPDIVTEAIVSAVALMGIAGETAAHIIEQRGLGTGSFRTALIDAISLADVDVLMKKSQITRIKNDNFDKKWGK